ncbi:MAG TPA: hypothetical protein VHJ58_14980 [Vicinamibacterales bacterium]|nr:hypothetical protein [Vicinamibacterales bacterium]
MPFYLTRARFLIIVPAEDGTSPSMTLLQNWAPHDDDGSGA